MQIFRPFYDSLRFQHTIFTTKSPPSATLPYSSGCALPSIGVKLESNCSIIEEIPPKGESFSDFIATFAMSVGFDTYFDLQH